MTFPEPRAWQLVVKRVEDATPLMRRIALTAPTLDRFSWLPGQDVSLAFTAGDGSTVRRRYSIRSFDPQHRLLEINVVMHGNGPGRRWADTASAGAEIEAIAPRGKITLAAGAPWHLFAGDATAVPAAFAMMEALPAGVPALGFFLVDDEHERQLHPGSALARQIEWRYAGNGSADTQLIDAIRDSNFPAGQGHAYLAGEVALVSSLKAAMLALGWQPEQIAAKAYWNRGRPNQGHGEPEQKAS